MVPALFPVLACPGQARSCIMSLSFPCQAGFNTMQDTGRVSKAGSPQLPAGLGCTGTGGPAVGSSRGPWGGLTAWSFCSPHHRGRQERLYHQAAECAGGREVTYRADSADWSWAGAEASLPPPFPFHFPQDGISSSVNRAIPIRWVSPIQVDTTVSNPPSLRRKEASKP